MLRLWLYFFIYAVLTGLIVQLVILPYVFPQLHAGNGLLSGRDWVSFHEQAVVMAQRIELDGWGEFLLRPDGDNAITGVTSFFYILFGPHPWTLLPLNATVFAIGGVTLFSLLKHLNLEYNEALVSILPYLVFPSALLQYGQIHRDVFCTTAVLAILWSWVSLLRADRTLWQICSLIAASTMALLTLSVFRPYLISPFLGLGILLLLWCLARGIGQFFLAQNERVEKKYQTRFLFNVQSITILIILNALTYGISISYLDVRLRPVPIQDIHAKVAVPIFIWRSNQGVRSVGDAQTISAREFSEVPDAKKIEALLLESVDVCQPVVIIKENAFFENLMNRVFIKIAVARAGFTTFAYGTTAATNIDQDVKFCKKEDLIRYIPRALQIALFAPFPSSWFMLERRNSSSIEVFISAAEMSVCYVTLIGLLYWLVSYQRWKPALVIPLGFALGMTLLLGLTVANVGTLYRMRFPYAMIFACIGLAGILQFVKVKFQPLRVLVRRLIK